MTASIVSSNCRLTVISPRQRLDLAVPVQLSVAELMGIVLSSLGPEVADLGSNEGGWILQRAAEAPLDPSATVAASQLRDGDVLHLRTRAGRMPEVAFDDVLEAVATGVLTRTTRWLPAYTTRMATVFAGALLAFCYAVLVVHGPKWVVPSVVAGVISVLLVLAATGLRRVYRKRGPALTAAAFAIAYAVSCGATAVGGHHSVFGFGAPQVLVGACAAAFVSTVLLITVVDGIAGLVTVITLSLLVAIATAVASGTDLSAAATASIIAAVALAVSPLLPTLSFRLSRLPLPLIPTDAADLQRDTATVDPTEILGKAVRADQYLTGLVGGVGLGLAAAALLIAGDGVSEYVLAVILSLICLFRARLFTGRAQRAVLLAAGAAGGLSVLANGAIDTSGTTRVLVFVVPAAVVALVLFALAVILPERRYAPPVSRAADVLESLMVLSVIPLALAVMGVYGKIRGLSD